MYISLHLLMIVGCFFLKLFVMVILIALQLTRDTHSCSKKSETENLLCIAVSEIWWKSFLFSPQASKTVVALYCQGYPNTQKDDCSSESFHENHNIWLCGGSCFTGSASFHLQNTSCSLKTLNGLAPRYISDLLITWSGLSGHQAEVFELYPESD